MSHKYSYYLLGVLFFLSLSVLKGETILPSPKNYPAISQASDSYQITIGDEKAQITVIEYTALACGHCAYFHTTVLPEIKKKYIDTEKVRFIFRHFPIDHYSLKATAIVNQVPLPKRLATINKIFSEQKEWVGGSLVEKLSQICELPLNKCKEVVKNEKDLNQALQPRLEAEKIAPIEGTPTFFIDGQMYSAALTEAEFDKIINQKKPSSQ
jgi:protein-disulfide isomerase